MADEERDETIVSVPVSFYAHYDNKTKKINRLVVMPLESYAGYFGPGSVVWDGDEGLDVRSTNGPFWRAMQDTSMPIEWEE